MDYSHIPSSTLSRIYYKKTSLSTELAYFSLIGYNKTIMEIKRNLVRLAPLVLAGAFIQGDTNIIPKKPAEIAEYNRNFASNIIQKVGISNLYQTIEIIATENPRGLSGQPWLTMTMQGTFYNNRGQRLEAFIDSKGNPIISRPMGSGYEVNYTLNTQDNEPKSLDNGRNFLVCYGNHEICLPTTLNKIIVGSFLDDYFRNSAVEFNVIHMDFRKEKKGFVNIGDLKKPPIPENLGRGQTLFSFDEKAGQIRRIDIIVNLSEIHSHALKFGLSLDQALKEVFANEKINLIGTLRIRNKTSDQDDSLEALSTLAGYVGMADQKNDLTTELLGWNHQAFISMLASGMEETAEIIRR